MNTKIIYSFSVPGEEKPFYIGKGEPNRPSQHFQDHNRFSESTNFYCKLNQLLLNGIWPYVKIIASGLTNEQANDMECSLIRIYGRLDQGTGCLTNMTDGGEGTSGSKSKEARDTDKEVARTLRGKAVESYDLDTNVTIKRYPCMSDVALDGYDRASVTRVADGKKKTAYGMGWRRC